MSSVNQLCGPGVAVGEMSERELFQELDEKFLNFDEVTTLPGAPSPLTFSLSPQYLIPPLLLFLFPPPL